MGWAGLANYLRPDARKIGFVHINNRSCSTATFGGRCVHQSVQILSPNISNILALMLLVANTANLSFIGNPYCQKRFGQLKSFLSALMLVEANLGNTK